MIDYDRVKAVVMGLVDKKASMAPKKGYDQDPTDVSADIDTILASTEKLLAINKGLAEPDERDSMEFRRFYTPDKLLAERIQMDAGKIRQTLMRRVSRARSLKPVGVDHMGPYAEGLIVGHMLSSPLEEINPAHIIEQQRRISAMGPGGLPSDDSITPASQNTHPSQFGFIDPLAGPESSRIGVDVRAAYGTRIGDDGKIYQRFKNRRDNRYHWLSPSDVVNKVVAVPD